MVTSIAKIKKNDRKKTFASQKRLSLFVSWPDHRFLPVSGSRGEKLALARPRWIIVAVSLDGWLSQTLQPSFAFGRDPVTSRQIDATRSSNQRWIMHRVYTGMPFEFSSSRVYYRFVSLLLLRLPFLSSLPLPLQFLNPLWETTTTKQEKKKVSFERSRPTREKYIHTSSVVFRQQYHDCKRLSIYRVERNICPWNFKNFSFALYSTRREGETFPRNRRSQPI